MNIKCLVMIPCMAVLSNSNVYAGRTGIDVSEAVRSAVEATAGQLQRQFERLLRHQFWFGQHIHCCSS